MRTDDDEPGALAKLVAHVINAMNWRMVLVAGVVSFFFCYGAANAFIKLTGRNLASFDFPPGPIIGLLGASGIVILIIAAKLRPPR